MTSGAPLTATPAPARAWRGRSQPLTISYWLLAVAALVFLMVVVGGITRLTESGLSIVRWDVVTGTLPPLNQADWQTAFDLYRTSPQYEQINRGMTLAEFKEIFFWEYVHRLLGRIIGVAFALPLAWFAWRRAIPTGYGWRLVVLLALGGLQGAIGWWMVASGLIDRPEVSHIRLAIHLLAAMLILGALVWTALDLRTLARDPAARPVRMPTAGIWALSLLALQIMFGAYVAGLEAGYAFSSWPKMGDEWFPADAPMMEPFLRNFADNPIVVQFVHRWLAFAVAAAMVALGLKATRSRSGQAGPILIGVVALQIMLGIATLLSGVAIEIAVAHQATAALLLIATVTAAHALGRSARPRPPSDG